MRGDKRGSSGQGGLRASCLWWFSVSLSTDAKVLTTAYTALWHLARRYLSGPISSFAPLASSVPATRPLYPFSLLCNKSPPKLAA